jgi:hypothetical protein
MYYFINLLFFRIAQDSLHFLEDPILNGNAMKHTELQARLTSATVSCNRGWWSWSRASVRKKLKRTSKIQKHLSRVRHGGCIQAISLALEHVPCQVLFSNFILLLCWVGVHCGIYKGSYNKGNISYLNSPSTILLYLPFPHLRNSFNRYFFSICIYVYTVFVPYSSSYVLSPPPPSSNW